MELSQKIAPKTSPKTAWKWYVRVGIISDILAGKIDWAAKKMR